jgi:hypothetical protein
MELKKQKEYYMTII